MNSCEDCGKVLPRDYPWCVCLHCDLKRPATSDTRLYPLEDDVAEIIEEPEPPPEPPGEEVLSDVCEKCGDPDCTVYGQEGYGREVLCTGCWRLIATPTEEVRSAQPEKLAKTLFPHRCNRCNRPNAIYSKLYGEQYVCNFCWWELSKEQQNEMA